MIKKITYGILLLFALSLFGAAVKYIYSGGKKLGFFTQPLIAFTSFPELTKQAISELTETPEQYQKTPKNFISVNKLKEDVFVLSSISEGFYKRKIMLRNLKTETEIKEWRIDFLFDKNDRIFSPLMLSDSSVILNVSEKTMLKINKKGEVLWQLEKPMATHHSLNIDAENNLWTLGKTIDGNNKTILSHVYDSGNGRKLFFADEYVLKIDAKTGKILYKKSLTEMFLENELEHELKKAQFIEGPFHSNDVEPVLFSSNYFQKGDVFVSLRNMSLVVHFRPSSNKIVRTIEGSFTFQHDIDIMDSTTISIFNNNTINQIEKVAEKRQQADKITTLKTENSNIVYYNFKTNKFNFPLEEVFLENNIFTHYEGLVHWFDKDIALVEEQEKGVLWVIKNGEVVYKNVHASEENGYHHMMNWTRVVEK